MFSYIPIVKKILLPSLLPPSDPSVKSDLNSETFLSPTCCFHTRIEYLVCYFRILSCFALHSCGWGYMACITLSISFLSFTCEQVMGLSEFCVFLWIYHMPCKWLHSIPLCLINQSLLNPFVSGPLGCIIYGLFELP